MEEKFVVWDEKYSVGNPKIDEQHKHLVKLINALWESCKQGKSEADKNFAVIIKEAAEYVRTHFNTEEQLMTKYNYPDYKNHKVEHETFIVEILNSVKEFQEGKQFVPNKFVRYLRDWLLQHIAISDKKYTPFIKDSV